LNRRHAWRTEPAAMPSLCRCGSLSRPGDFDVAVLVDEMVEGESVPFLPNLRYKPTGLRKRKFWERTWELQRQEDAGKKVGDIPVPPKYTSADFQKTDYWRLRANSTYPRNVGSVTPTARPTVTLRWSSVGPAGTTSSRRGADRLLRRSQTRRLGRQAADAPPSGLRSTAAVDSPVASRIDQEFGETAGQSYQTYWSRTPTNSA